MQSVITVLSTSYSKANSVDSSITVAQACLHILSPCLWSKVQAESLEKHTQTPAINYVLEKMAKEYRSRDHVHWYMGELGARAAAASGRPADRYHLGRLVLACLEEHPDFVLQVDGATGEQETCASVRARSVRCAQHLRALGFKPGDVMALLAPNHLDLAIPFYAALYLGLVIMAVDRTLKDKELQDTFEVGKPKVVFCQNEKGVEVEQALKAIGCQSKIITFDCNERFQSFADFLAMSKRDSSEQVIFKANELDAKNALCAIIATSGTTGLPKAAGVTYKNIALGTSYSLTQFTQFPRPYKSALVLSPLQWYSALFHFFCSAIHVYTRIQTSAEPTRDHAYELINKYRPSNVLSSPNTFTMLAKEPDHQHCDFSCFQKIYMGGSAVPEQLLAKYRELAPNAVVTRVYGMSELVGLAFHPDPTKAETCGRRKECFEYRLQDPFTREEIVKPNVNGELQLRGPAVFKGYFNNAKATRETFTEDGWFRTGDLFFRDEDFKFYFVERFKLLLKYRNHQIAPLELENVIRSHPGVLDVAVASVPDAECGDLPVACVVRRPGRRVTAQEVKDLVKKNLTDTKQLRGGVIFLDQLPMTASMKLHRKKINQLILSSIRE